jgi:hypothetical protein
MRPLDRTLHKYFQDCDCFRIGEHLRERTDLIVRQHTQILIDTCRVNRMTFMILRLCAKCTYHPPDDRLILI